MVTEERKGFTLIEILTATIVMSVLMLAVIGFVQSGSELWNRGHDKITARNYQRAIFEILRQDMMKASHITQPALGETDVRIRYETFESATFTIELDNFSLGRIPESGGHTLRLARNVASFTATRLSTWTIKIYLELASEENMHGERETLMSDSVTFMAPGVL